MTPRNKWKEPTAEIRLLPDNNQVFFLHKVDRDKQKPDCLHPDCIVRKIMES